MSQMTRGQMETRMATALDEAPGTRPYARPETRATAIYEACDELAEGTYIYETTETADIVAGQEEYCASRLYFIRSVYAKWDDGSICILSEQRTEAFDQGSRAYWPWANSVNWRSDPLYDGPRYWMPRGVNRGRLYPIPNYNWAANGLTGASATAVIVNGVITAINVVNAGSGATAPPRVFIAGDGSGAAATVTLSGSGLGVFTVTNGGGGYNFANVMLTGGLAFEGYGVPTSALWPNAASVCPLPSMHHDTVFDLACLNRMREFPTHGDNQVKIPLYEAKYRERRGKLVRYAHEQSAAIRSHAQNRIHFIW